MASQIKRGETILIPFLNGVSVYDSQLKPRMYKTKRGFERQFPSHLYPTSNLELVEFGEVRHGRWILTESPYAEYEEGMDGESHPRYVCSLCSTEAGFGRDPDGFATDQELSDYCPGCGAKMDAEVHDDA